MFCPRPKRTDDFEFFFPLAWFFQDLRVHAGKFVANEIKSFFLCFASEKKRFFPSSLSEKNGKLTILEFLFAWFC